MFEIECASFVVTQSTTDVVACPSRYRFLFFKAALLGEAMKGTLCVNPAMAVDGNVLANKLYKSTQNVFEVLSKNLKKRLLSSLCLSVISFLCIR
jgi:hypothetical protein